MKAMKELGYQKHGVIQLSTICDEAFGQTIDLKLLAIFAKRFSSWMLDRVLNTSLGVRMKIIRYVKLWEIIIFLVIVKITRLRCYTCIYLIIFVERKCWIFTFKLQDTLYCQDEVL